MACCTEIDPNREQNFSVPADPVVQPFVGCRQGIALVPVATRKVRQENVVVHPLDEVANPLTTAMTWDASRSDPLAGQVVASRQPRKKPVEECQGCKLASIPFNHHPRYDSRHRANMKLKLLLT